MVTAKTQGIRHAILLVTSLFIAATSTSIAASTIWTPHGESEFIGHAIDKQTGMPVPNAAVLGIYILSLSNGHEQVDCSVAEFARANAAGEYVLPFHEGYPPTFIYAVGRRYKTASWPRTVTRDIKDPFIRWIVIEYSSTGGKNREVRREGPFWTQAEAYKASRIRQDVWLQRFDGTDDQWLHSLLSPGIGPGCPSSKTPGVVGWEWALLQEAESMPDSPQKRDVVDTLKKGFKLAEDLNPQGANRLRLELGQ